MGFRCKRCGRAIRWAITTSRWVTVSGNDARCVEPGSRHQPEPA